MAERVKPSKLGISFKDYLDPVLSHLRETLVSHESRRAIQSLGLNIPGPLAFSAFGFECRLGEEEGISDFLISLSRDNEGPDFLAHSEWWKIQEFGRFWGGKSTDLSAGIDDVWLEFDLKKNAKKIPVPSLFFSPLQGFSTGKKIFWGKEKFLLLMETVFRILHEKPPCHHRLGQWQRLVEAAPSLESIFQVGFMISRSHGKSTRFCIRLPLDTPLKKYLLDVGWPGKPAKLVPMLETLTPFFNTVAVHLDVDDETSPKLGLEFKFQGRPGPEREKRWRPFLHQLESQGLCTHENGIALIEFPGYAQTDPDICPPPLAHMIRRLDSSYRSFFIRTIYHIKLVYGQDGQWEAKAYLGVNHLWKALQGESIRGRGPWGVIG